MSVWSTLNKIADVIAEKGPDVVDSIIKAGAKQLSEQAKNTEQQLKEYERKIQLREQSGRPLTTEEREKIQEAKGNLDKVKEKLYGTANTSGKSFQDWEREWTSIGSLATANLSPYNHSVGVYRHWYQGKVVYIGRAIELNNGGFRKRLSDYRRGSDSSRRHTSGKIINQHLEDIYTDIIVVGVDENAVAITRKLEVYLIGKYSPEWNKLHK